METNGSFPSAAAYVECAFDHAYPTPYAKTLPCCASASTPSAPAPTPLLQPCPEAQVSAYALLSSSEPTLVAYADACAEACEPRCVMPEFSVPALCHCHT